MLEAGLAGHGPSGRNGGFVSTLWDDLPILRDRVGDARAVDVCRASERAVRGIGAWCEANGVDAWYRAGGTLQVATSEAQLGDWDDVVEACASFGAAEEAVPLSRGGGRAALRLTGLPRRDAAAACGERPAGTALTRAPREGHRGGGSPLRANARADALARRRRETPQAAPCAPTPRCSR